jgi:hypothetical protein
MTYSSSLALSRQQYGSRHRNAVTFRASERTLGPISNTIILIVLACVLGLLYLTQVTKTNAYGYTINDLKVKQTQLESQHDDLEVASARLQSLDRVKNSSVATAMVAASPSGTVN